MRDLAAFLGILLLLPLLMQVVAMAGGRWGFSGELKRKAIHVGMGLACLSFPWLFSSWLWVAGLCGISILLMILVRLRGSRTGERGPLHEIDRHSLGEIYFPLAVVAVFALAEGQPWRYVIPVLILTLADAAGALVGVSYGRQKFHVLSGWKTIEGSLLVFFVAFLSVHIPLLLMTGIGRAETLLIALVVAILAMLVEAVSVQGLDNLILPLLVALLLPMFAGLSQADLLLRAAVAAGLLLVVLGARRASSLEGGALLAAVLLGYAACFVGGWRFLVPPLILFAEHLLVSRRLRRAQLAEPLQSNDLWVICGLAIAFAPGLALAAWRPQEHTLALRSLSTAAAIHLACVHYTTCLFATNRPPTARLRRRAVVKAALLLIAPGFLLSGRGDHLPVLACVSLLLVPLGLLIFRRALGDPGGYPNNRQRWLVQGGACVAGSLPLWAVNHLLTR